MVRKMTVVVIGTTLAVTACSGSDGTDTPPALDRIDGPAQVDPSFDPMRVDPSVPPGSDPG